MKALRYELLNEFSEWTFFVNGLKNTIKSKLFRTLLGLKLKYIAARDLRLSALFLYISMVKLSNIETKQGR